MRWYSLCLSLFDISFSVMYSSSIHVATNGKIFLFFKSLNNIPYFVYLASLVAQMGKKESASNTGDSDSIHGSGKSPREGNEHVLQYSCLENSVNRGAWQFMYYIFFTQSSVEEDLDCFHINKTAMIIAKWTVEIVIEKLAVSNTKLGDNAADDITSNP